MICVWLVMPSSLRAQEVQKQGVIGVTLSNASFLAEQVNGRFVARGEPHTVYHVKNNEGVITHIGTDATGKIPINLTDYIVPTGDQSASPRAAIWIDY
ncbi:MAG: hypothetical protein J0L77_08165 [Alphaproteobacteria bacterium]|nr:hypothetical protein [Alphaproteobacteria bacterium]